jgi:hypothetical protein
VNDNETDKDGHEDVLEGVVIAVIEFQQSMPNGPRIEAAGFDSLAVPGKLTIEIFQCFEVVVPPINVPLGLDFLIPAG